MCNLSHVQSLCTSLCEEKSFKTCWLQGDETHAQKSTEVPSMQKLSSRFMRESTCSVIVEAVHTHSGRQQESTWSCLVDQEKVSAVSAQLLPDDSSKTCTMAIVVVFLVSGTVQIVVQKLQNRQRVPACSDPLSPRCAPRYCESPILQSFVMFLGEFFCLYLDDVIRLLDCSERKVLLDVCTGASSQGLQFEAPERRAPSDYRWIMPGVLDFVGSAFYNIGSVFAYASTIQMLRNCNALIVAFLSLVVIGIAFRVYQWVGIIIITAGLALASWFSVDHPDPSVNQQTYPWIGLACAVVGGLCTSYKCVLEERLFRDYAASPMRSVGIEGLVGVVTGIAGLVVASALGYESVRETLYQASRSNWILLSLVLQLLSSVVFNASGAILTKFGTALMKTVLVTLRSFFVWLFEISFGWNTFNLLDFSSSLLLILGVSIYCSLLLPQNPRIRAFLQRPMLCFDLLVDPDTCQNVNWMA